jgi:glycosyltransferase involved in cell wall biosynthesis
MTRPVRLTAVMTHPVQYSAPWFRYIAAHCPEIDLTVLYAATPTPRQQGREFGAEFEWDVPLTDGYRCRVVRASAPGADFDSRHFRGLDVPEIAPALADTRPDVALVPGWHSITLARALWACRRRAIPVLYRGDNQLPNAPSGARRLAWSARTRHILRLFEGYLAVGARARGYLARFGVDPSRVFASPHAVDNEFFARAAAPYQTAPGRALAREAFGLGPRDFVILFAGKLEAKKRPLDAIHATARLGADVSLLIAGGGELEASCRAEAAKVGARVAWAGFLNQSELGRAYAAADCLVLPSDGRETWGLVVNEALATGLPCLVSDRVGCAPDLIVSGETGEIFPVGEIAPLAAALERVRARAAGGHDWAPACRARVSAHSFPRATAGVLAACQALTEPRAPARPVPSPRVLVGCGGMVIVAGAERITFEVLRGLVERGAAVHCLVNSWRNYRIAHLAEQVGATWSAGGYRYQLERRARSPLAWARTAWDIARTSAVVLGVAARVRPSHVLVVDHQSALHDAPALAAVRAAGVPVVMHVHNAPAPGRFYRRLWRWVINPLVSRFVCCSAETRSRLLEHGLPARKLSVIENIAPLRSRCAVREAAGDRRSVVYVGQIIPEKGIDLLLDALALVRARGHDARGVIVGQMEGWIAPEYAGYRERLASRAAAPDLAGQVRFLGWRDDVPSVLAAAGIHCLPSRPEMREGMPLVCLEAKWAGVPSVVSPVGSLPGIVRHRVDGFVCRGVSAEALAEGIEYFLVDPARWDGARRAARASAARFDPEHFEEAWWNVFAPGDPRRAGRARFETETR